MCVYVELFIVYLENGVDYVYLKNVGSWLLVFFFGWVSFWVNDVLLLLIMVLVIVSNFGFLMFIDLLFGKFIVVGLIIVFMLLYLCFVEGGAVF